MNWGLGRRRRVQYEMARVPEIITFVKAQRIQRFECTDDGLKMVVVDVVRRTGNGPRGSGGRV